MDDEVENGEDHVTLQIDDWLCVRLESQLLESIYLLRQRFQQALQAKVAKPRSRLEASQYNAILAIQNLLEYEWQESGLDYSSKWTSKSPPEFHGRWLHVLPN